MAEILFSSPEAQERYENCRTLTEGKGDKSLQDCIECLRRWARPIMIGRDYDRMSFTFREILTEEETYKGIRPVVGGIIYHGPHDGFGSGDGPTFSCCITPTSGYQIHT